MPIDSLEPWPGNPRRHAQAAVCESLELNGQYRAVIAQAGTRRLIAGHGTWEAAKALGWKEIAVDFDPVDDELAERILLVDNRTNDLAYELGYVAEELAAMLGRQPTFAGTGYDEDALKDLLASMPEAPVEGRTDPDEVPPLPLQPVTQLGDVWLLGEHRLLCGDATSATDLDDLMAGERAEMVWTDPPYGVAIVGRTEDALTIQGDEIDASKSYHLVQAALVEATRRLRPGGAYYVCSSGGENESLFRRAIADAGLTIRQGLVWVKQVFVLGRQDYHWRHETILYGWTAGAAHYFGGDRTQDTVLDATPDVSRLSKAQLREMLQAILDRSTVVYVDRPHASRLHPTMKPVDLVARFLVNSSRPTELVLDPFGGAGSTLIAAYRHQRRARLMEIDPAYCDVICRRFQEFTGTLPVLEATGEAHDFTGGADGSSDREIA